MGEVDKLRALDIASPQESVAKAIERLSSEDKIKMMSVIKSKKDAASLEAMFSVGEELSWDWLVRTANNRLMLWVSCDKGRGRRDVVVVVKNPDVKEGGLKEKISSFIKSE